MIRATSPLYVSRANEQAFAPPYRQAGCSLYAFADPGRARPLQRIVDRFLADPTDGRVQPRVDADHVLLYFCDFAQSQSHDPVDAGGGWLGERECGLWIPLRVDRVDRAGLLHPCDVRRQRSGDVLRARGARLPQGDRPAHVPRDPRTRATTLARRPGDRARDARAPGRWQPLVELERLEGRSASRPRRRGAGRSSSASTSRWTARCAVRAPLRALARASRGQADFYNLKQFRDCADRGAPATRPSFARAPGSSRRVASRRRELRLPHPPLPQPPARRRARPAASGRVRGLFLDDRPRLRARRGPVTAHHRRKIAVLGGGVGAMSAVWALTEAPDWHERLEITVYQLGWRLGGKGASGRNAAHGQRIEEHGLHIWLGWYDNAFAMLRKCYEELGRPADAPLARLEDAFVAHDFVGVAHGATSHGRSFWMVDFPRTARRVGEGRADPPARSPDVALKLVARHLESSQLRPIRPETPRDDGRAACARPTAAGAVRRLLRSAAARLLARLDAAASRAIPRPSSTRRRGCSSCCAAAWPASSPGRAGPRTSSAGLRMLLDFGAATLRGLVHDRALLFGLDVLDDWDLREWLARHGARPETPRRRSSRPGTTSRSPTRTATPRARTSRPARRSGRSSGPASPTRGPSSGRCRPAWATSCSRRCTRCCAVAVSASSSSTASTNSRSSRSRRRRPRSTGTASRACG
jgi:hypothetical protein